MDACYQRISFIGTPKFSGDAKETTATILVIRDVHCTLYTVHCTHSSGAPVVEATWPDPDPKKNPYSDMHPWFILFCSSNSKVLERED